MGAFPHGLGRGLGSFSQENNPEEERRTPSWTELEKQEKSNA